MHHARWIGTLGFALAGVVLLSIGGRPEIRASQPTGVVAAASVGGAFGGAQEDREDRPKLVHLDARPMTIEATRVWLKLQDKIPMHFPGDTTLEDVVKHIRESTVDKAGLPEGIPIYVDPVGLQEADKTLASTVRLDLKGIPLATTLKLALAQLDLVYRIHPDGLLQIVAKDDESADDREAMILNEIGLLRQEVRGLHAELRLLRGAPLPENDPAGRPTPRGQATGLMGGGFR